jgi:hypothetical protein
MREWVVLKSLNNLPLILSPSKDESHEEKAARGKPLGFPSPSPLFPLRVLVAAGGLVMAGDLRDKGKLP